MIFLTIVYTTSSMKKEVSILSNLSSINRSRRGIVWEIKEKFSFSLDCTKPIALSFIFIHLGFSS